MVIAGGTELRFTGDLVLDEPEPDHWLSGLMPALRPADVLIGHLEVPHTRQPSQLPGDVPAPGADPAHLAALGRAGFTAVTLAGNHIADCGAGGIADTCAALDGLGIARCGAGRDAAEAFRPALLASAGRRIGLLSYNCVGPENAWAGPGHAGCAYLRIRTRDAVPVAPSADLVEADTEAIDRLYGDIAALRPQVGLVVVALHKGIVHTPARLAPYERPLARAAIDAGADLVIAHHAHILRGIEFHRGRPIFHGLGNGCVVTRALSPTTDHPARAAWAQRRRQLFGFEPDPAYALAPFHPDAVHAMLARVRWQADGQLQAGFVPVHVDPPGRPLVATGDRARAVARYLERITVEAGLAPLTLREDADGYIVT